MHARRPYQLIDVGGGARLERFGDRLVDRPHPAALGSRADPERWPEADLRFDRERGWTGPAAAEGAWPIDLAGLTLELRPTEAGQVGIFPEHLAMIDWLEARVGERLAAAEAAGQPAPSVLNLFAYTGLVTLAIARAGGSVAHVDSSRPTVSWARRNAERSGLAERPIRWIVDDAGAFTGREARRGHRHAGIALDPPSYGHGPGGRSWRLADDLDGLPRRPQRCSSRTASSCSRRTPGFDGDRLADISAGHCRDERPPSSAGRWGDDGRRTPARARRLRSLARRRRMRPMPAHDRPVLTSAANPTVKAAIALRDRRARRTGLTLVDGARELRRAIEAGAVVAEAFVCEPILAGVDAKVVLDGLHAAGTRVHAVSEPLFAKLAFGDRLEGLVGVVRIPSVDLTTLRLPVDALVVIIEGVEKPGNVGAVLRSADGAPAPVAIAPTRGPTCSAPSVIRASAGTAFSVPIAAASTPMRSPGSPGRECASSRPGSTRTGSIRDRPHRPAGHRSAPRRTACRTPGMGRVSRQSGCPCSVWRTASTSRSPPRSSCTRRAASEGSRARCNVVVDSADHPGDQCPIPDGDPWIPSIS
jgi:23S rRNA (cytosine1962-C5)-methyltransferase